MDTCYYHPDAKAKFTCPDCGEDVCDRCRIDGGLQRCGSCATNGPPPDGPRVREEEPPAEIGEGEIVCAIHPFIAADMQCLNCLQAFCMDCLPDGQMCAECRRDPHGRAAPHEEYVPTDVPEVGYDSGVDFGGYGAAASGDYGGGYAEDGAPAPRPRRPAGAGGAGGSGSRKNGPPGKKGPGGKKGPAKKKAAGPPIAAIAGGVVALLALGGAGWYFTQGQASAEFAGSAKVAIVGPKTATVKGNQVIKLNVSSADLIDKVEVKVDGKYWAKFGKDDPKYETDWPTGILPAGPHVVTATAIYKNGPTVSDKKTFTVQTAQ